jgi:hypothetical protein
MTQNQDNVAGVLRPHPNTGADQDVNWTVIAVLVVVKLT